MKFSCRLAVFSGSFFIVFFLATSQASSQRPYSGSRLKIVDTREQKGTAKVALAVNEDGEIVLLEAEAHSVWNLNDRLGYAASGFGETPARPRVRETQVVKTVRTLTYENGAVRLWFILAIGFSVGDSSAREGLSVRSFVYVFREEKSRFQQLLETSFPEVLQFIVDDVNQDDLPEFAIQYMDASPFAPSTWLQLWSVTRKHDLQPIPLENVLRELKTSQARKSRVEFGDYRHGDAGIYTEQESVLAEGTKITRRYFQWDQRLQVYALTDSFATLEKGAEVTDK